ncbi:MAG: gamma-glutamylcyclotransferase [Paracoccaceae bacterium]
MTDALWVFGYGSLIWNPGFAFAERVVARLDGWHRSFCMDSIHYRGTPQAPGLVLALDRAPGSACLGVAFRIPAETAAETLDYLRERELISSAYLEDRLPVHLTDGRRETAVTYVINRDHCQYRGGLALEDQARIIAASAGDNGPNRDYLFATASHLESLGIADPDLGWLVARVNEIAP